MTFIRRVFRRLGLRRKLLIMNACSKLFAAAARLRYQRFDRALAWAADRGRGTHTPDELRWAVAAAARRIPGATCLVQALALQRLLAQSGHRSQLRIGVDKAGAEFDAHAWLMLEGEPWFGHTEKEYRFIGEWDVRLDATPEHDQARRGGGRST